MAAEVRALASAFLQAYSPNSLHNLLGAVLALVFALCDKLFPHFHYGSEMVLGGGALQVARLYALALAFFQLHHLNAHFALPQKTAVACVLFLGAASHHVVFLLAVALRQA